MTTVVAFLLAGAAGGALRFWARGLSGGWPWGTLAVNLTGSFLVGLIAAWSPPTATVVGTAGVGALTTYSTFAAEVVDMWRRSPAAALGYATVSIVVGIVLAWAGLVIAG